MKRLQQLELRKHTSFISKPYHNVKAHNIKHMPHIQVQLSVSVQKTGNLKVFVTITASNNGEYIAMLGNIKVKPKDCRFDNGKDVTR